MHVCRLMRVVICVVTRLCVLNEPFDAHVLLWWGMQVVKDSLTLNNIARSLRQRRFDGGALRCEPCGSGNVATDRLSAVNCQPHMGLWGCPALTDILLLAYLYCLHVLLACTACMYCRLDNTRLYFKLDAEGNPCDYGVYEQVCACSPSGTAALLHCHCTAIVLLPLRLEQNS
jgi:hypothetical protein